MYLRIGPAPSGQFVFEADDGSGVGQHPTVTVTIPSSGVDRVVFLIAEGFNPFGFTVSGDLTWTLISGPTTVFGTERDAFYWAFMPAGSPADVILTGDDTGDPLNQYSVFATIISAADIDTVNPIVQQDTDSSSVANLSFTFPSPTFETVTNQALLLTADADTDATVNNGFVQITTGVELVASHDGEIAGVSVTAVPGFEGGVGVLLELRGA